METYFQRGVQDACQQEELPDQPKISCPPKQPANFSNVAAQVFASESCMGCHSSAGFYKTFDAKTGKGQTWPQLSGDFSWLPDQKACYIASGGETGPRICINN